MTDWTEHERPTSTRGRDVVVTIFEHGASTPEPWVSVLVPSIAWSDHQLLGRLAVAGADLHHDQPSEGHCRRIVVLLSPGVDRATFLARLASGD